MGRVYLAEHVKMNRQCAIKVMNPSLVNDSESSQRFAREASNAARILHPNVAAVFDYGESDKIVTFLTRDLGKVTGIAKGAKHSKRRFVNVLEPFTHV